MRKYEVMYIIRPDVEQEAVQATVEKFQGIIQNGGEITKHEVLGNAAPEVVAELERILKISDEVIRYLITKDVA